MYQTSDLRQAIGGWFDRIPVPVQEKAAALINRAMEEDRTAPVFPPQDKIFRALALTQPENCKVVIVGQDPYHGQGQANGLAFSVDPQVKAPPSLHNIMAELANDLGTFARYNVDLTPWARQGVLLLNTVLTVSKGRAASHTDWGWQEFTSAILKACLDLPQPVVFIRWGAHARTVLSDGSLTGHPDKMTVTSSHPSPFSAYNPAGGYPAFFGSKPFSTANHMLVAMGSAPVDWKDGIAV